VMRCIHAPGDYGWVDPVEPEMCRWIADYEQLFTTRDEAIRVWVETLKTRIAEAERELALWESPNVEVTNKGSENEH